MAATQPPSDAAHDKSVDDVLNAMAAVRAGPNAKDRKPVGLEEFQAVLDSTPLFMKETPEESGEENYVLDALKSLVFEGEGDEVAIGFKTHGNELYAQRSYRDAIDAYTSGIKSAPTDPELRTSLLNNRAAANLQLQNYGAVLKDTASIIAIAAAQDPPADAPVKSLYRAGQALAALDKWDEAADVVARGRKLPGWAGDKQWDELSARVDKGQKASSERKERERRKTLMEFAKKRALSARGLVVRRTNSPPDNPHPLDFDPDNLPPAMALYPPEVASTWTPPPAHTPLVFPVFLLYPQHNQSDLITHFHEDTSFDDQLAVIFPSSPAAVGSPGHPVWSPWDEKREYYTDNLAVYVETHGKRLLKVGKGITLREVLAKAFKPAEGGKDADGVVLQDGLLSFVVLVKGKEEKEWIENFKRIRDGKK